MASAHAETAQVAALNDDVNVHHSPTAATQLDMADRPSTTEDFQNRQAEHNEAIASQKQQADQVETVPEAIEGVGPATDNPIGPPSPTISPVNSASSKSVLGLTLLLATGARHPYKIDEKYLKSRKVTAVDAQGHFDPRELSGYKLKELIWTDWRSEWEPRPASPSAIRLISMGRLLEDKSMLKELPLKMDDMNIMHMSVKPADFFDDDEAHGGTGKGNHGFRTRETADSGAGCRCVIL